ncbi:MAG: metallophosphoesterase [Oscillospiraceae bacterium]|nr:metallophosphoesterase [Oscillospiraceae bacterium]
MRVLVFSDSHGDVEAMKRACEQYNPDWVLHLGDCIRDAVTLQKELKLNNCCMVTGNCDLCSRGMDQRTLELQGVRIFLTHGHTYRVKFSPLRAILAAEEAQAQILCYGHTHAPLCEQRNGMWILNPGACGGERGTCGLIEIDAENGGVSCRIERIGGDPLDFSN